MSELRATTISDLAGTGPVTLTGQSAAKAWSSTNQTSFAVRDSFNISSATDEGAGLTALNLTSAMASVNYSVVQGAYPVTYTNHSTGWSISASIYRTWSSNGISAYTDVQQIDGLVQGDLA
jgi:hypothetical protein